ncbi:hypothetical protein Q3G72_015498 [Acer saccharum]|nr:hypothetical protein Q3G72_015498 [Acer saccharum]
MHQYNLNRKTHKCGKVLKNFFSYLGHFPVALGWCSGGRRPAAVWSGQRPVMVDRAAAVVVQWPTDRAAAVVVGWRPTTSGRRRWRSGSGLAATTMVVRQWWAGSGGDPPTEPVGRYGGPATASRPVVWWSGDRPTGW